MKYAALALVVGATLVATLACSITIPSVDIVTGPTTEIPIDVPRLADPSKEAYVTLGFGANELTLTPGAKGLVSGTVRTNLKDFEPTVKVNGSDVRIEQGDLNVDGLPNFNADNIVNEWNLKLGADPIRLRITGGAYQGTMDLGGLALTDLYVSDGAATVKVDFSAPNAGLDEQPALRDRRFERRAAQPGQRQLQLDELPFRGGDLHPRLRRHAPA